MGFRDPSNLYLIDFGLSSKFLDQDGKHIEKESQGKFCGNFIFASLSSCKGNNKSRRDDMQSAMYLMVYLINRNYLPWINFGVEFPENNLQFHLSKRLDFCYIEEFFKIVPKSIKSMVKKVMILAFEDEPPYDYVI